MKDYPLQVETLHDCDNGDHVAYYSKGHHEPAAFVEAVLRDHGDEYPAEKVKHEYRRWQIIGCDGDWMRSLGSPRKGTTQRGVFPVTIIEW